MKGMIGRRLLLLIPMIWLVATLVQFGLVVQIISAILFIYAAIASMLPVWALLQPRDFINGMQLAVGLILLYGAVLIAGDGGVFRFGEGGGSGAFAVSVPRAVPLADRPGLAAELRRGRGPGAAAGQAAEHPAGAGPPR